MNDFYNSIYTKIGDINLPQFLEPESKIYFIGSCFSTNLYNNLKDIYLNCHEAPFGNVYNPGSISKCLDRVIKIKKVDKEDTIYINNLYQHHDFHSTLGKEDGGKYISNINNELESSYNFLKSSNLIILTLGTAYVFKKDGEIVNNCHKLSKSNFTRELLTIDEIVTNLDKTFTNIKELNPDIEIIVTLSPVRHLRDSFQENSLSKSILRVSIDELQKMHKLHYFPSYEILLDELRDYRWYSSDLAHPSKIAVDYIMDKFCSTCGSDSFSNYKNDAIKIKSLIGHKIINPESETSIKFIESKKRKIDEFKRRYPWANI